MSEMSLWTRMWRGSRTDLGDLIYKDDSVRLLSFGGWPNESVSREALVEAGFYYVGGVRGEGGDAVRCAWCGLELNNWLVGDCPRREHLRHRADCERVDRGEYATPARRLATFVGWPADANQKAEALAEAGFYYEGSDDRVRCFRCDASVWRWEPDDDPWREHARHSPDCGFLGLTRERRRRAAAEADVESHMESEDVKVALHCGLQPERIRGAIRRRLRLTGLPFRSSSQLIDAALNEQVNETPFQLPESGCSASAPVAPRRPIDDAIDQVANMIIRSAMMEETVPSVAPDREETAVTREENEEEPEKAPPDESKIPADISLEEENKILRDARMCKICLDAEVGIVFLPCGHLVSCAACATGLLQCPICRGSIKGAVRTYLS